MPVAPGDAVRRGVGEQSVSEAVSVRVFRPQVQHITGPDRRVGEPRRRFWRRKMISLRHFHVLTMKRRSWNRPGEECRLDVRINDAVNDGECRNGYSGCG